jgi:peptidoglycan/xylan/chitin deacetylase (PgdA/CDA1 family)
MAKMYSGKFKVIFSLDYEIHGNGDGDPMYLMIEPTWRLLKILETYGAKLTVFADVAQISKFKEYMEETGVDKFHFKKIKEQLQYCISNGHDVQLHIHSSFINSYYNGEKWAQYWDDYNLAGLPYETINRYIKKGKKLLEEILIPVCPNYTCNTFRAANWSMQPGKNILKALKSNGFKIDSSVYKWGKQTGNVNYDYTNAYHQIIPYPVSFENINRIDLDSEIFEVPIFCQQKTITSFITLIRVYRATRALFHRHRKAKNSSNNHTQESVKKPGILDRIKKMVNFAISKHPRKLDFNQLSSKQQITELSIIQEKYSGFEIDVPIVFIGHSKTFIKHNERVLKKVLNYVKEQNGFSYILYGDLKLETYRQYHAK